MSVITTSPTLSYVGAVDIQSTSGNGYTSYNIVFDQTLVTLASVLMFEYKLQNEGTPTNPSTVTLNYINTENAICQAGMANQWLINIPTVSYRYNPDPSVTVQVRVYAGVTGSPDIVVTDWSNELIVHVPPPKPVILGEDTPQPYAFYDIGVGQDDDLYVILVPDEDISYNEVTFTVAYYYADVTNSTVWNISEPTSASSVTIGTSSYRMVSVPNFGKVSSSSSLQVVYVSVYAVYQYIDVSIDGSYNYYSVSQVSQTVSANPASYFNSPTLDNINYQVYDSPYTSQNMVLTWQAPIPSVIPIYTVAYYIVEYSINNGSTWTLAENTAQLTSTFDASVINCGTTLSFRVKAVNTNGGVSQPSDVKTKNIFSFATAPQQAQVNWVVADLIDNKMDINFTFQNSASPGCNAGIVNYVVTVYNNDGDQLDTTTVPYVSSNSGYVVKFNEVTYSLNGYVTAYLITTDTNSTNNLPGAEVSVSFTAETVPIYKNLDVSGNTFIEFDILSRNPLAPVAGIVVPVTSTQLTYVNWFTDDRVQTDITVTETRDPVTNVFIYHVTMFSSVLEPFVSVFPDVFGIVSANSAGIGELPVSTI
jgi:hypothetical protein